MVNMMEDMAEAEKLKDETLHLAVSIADRYLINVGTAGKSAPCLIVLAVTSMMLAGKMTEPFCTSFD